MLWNSIARLINIDDVSFRNLKKANNSIICKHNKTKMDKARERYSNKNSCANLKILIFTCF